MAPRKSQRDRRATVAYEDKCASSTACAPKLTSKTARNKPKTALKPVAVEPLPELDYGLLSELPEYHSPFELHSLPSKSIATGLSKLKTFQKLYMQEVGDRIINATNSCAENAYPFRA
jgi:hypothetical protein